MAIPRTLARHLKVLIGHEVALDGDGYGATTYAPVRQVWGRVQSVVAPVKSQRGGTETVSSAVLYLRPTYIDGTPLVAVGVVDRFTLPDGHTPQQPNVIRVDRNEHDQGLYAWRVTV